MMRRSSSRIQPARSGFGDCRAGFVPESSWRTDTLHETLNKALVEDGGYKPRLAFGPVRVAMSGRRVSPPLFESMEIVGKKITLERLRGLREHLAEIQG